MHTLHDLEASDFRYRSNGNILEGEELVPAIDITDSVGVVMGAEPRGSGPRTSSSRA